MEKSGPTRFTLIRRARSSPPTRKHLFFLFRDGNWKFLLTYLVFTAAAIALWNTDREVKWVSGAQILVVPLAGIATATALYAVTWRLIGRRVGLGRIPAGTFRSILKWGLFSAVVGFAFAIAIELLLPRLFGGDPKASGWSSLAGPAEETGKLLIPVILWFKGRFRLPREGYFLWSGPGLFTVIAMYLLQKHSARQMVPPDNVAEVSPGWRPAAPKDARSAAAGQGAPAAQS